MGRRRRRKVVKVVKKKLPKYFVCPRCGAHAVKVVMGEIGSVAKVQCSQCGLVGEIQITGPSHPIDIYCKFSDLFYSGQIG